MTFEPIGGAIIRGKSEEIYKSICDPRALLTLIIQKLKRFSNRRPDFRYLFEKHTIITKKKKNYYSQVV